MEFFIDLATVRNITRQEEKQAREDIARLGAIGAHQQSLRRLDKRLAQASDASTLACKAGCSWCCHFSVDIRGCGRKLGPSGDSSCIPTQTEFEQLSCISS